MKSKTYNGKAFADGYAKAKAEAAETIRQLREALDKALAENLAMRPKQTESKGKCMEISDSNSPRKVVPKVAC